MQILRLKGRGSEAMIVMRVGAGNAHAFYVMEEATSQGTLGFPLSPDYMLGEMVYLES